MISKQAWQYMRTLIGIYKAQNNEQHKKKAQKRVEVSRGYSRVSAKESRRLSALPYFEKIHDIPTGEVAPLLDKGLMSPECSEPEDDNEKSIFRANAEKVTRNSGQKAFEVTRLAMLGTKVRHFFLKEFVSVKKSLV